MDSEKILGYEHIPGYQHTVLKYGDHDLQRVGVWRYPGQESSHAPWIIYNHGGGWRDPTYTLHGFLPTLKHILASPRFSHSRVAGFSSIDYRLCPHPDHPQDPATTPPNEYRNARHPDHADDVRSAVKLLHAKYGMERYIILGHSAGATMAYQLFMGEKATSVPPALGIIGLCGVYDLVGLCTRNPGYDSFVNVAFGADQSKWGAYAPADYWGSYSKVLGRRGTKKHVSMLASSTEDSLMGLMELDKIEAKLREDGVEVVVVKDLKGNHDEIWQEGSQVADLFLNMLDRVSEFE